MDSQKQTTIMGSFSSSMSEEELSLEPLELIVNIFFAGAFSTRRNFVFDDHYSKPNLGRLCSPRKISRFFCKLLDFTSKKKNKSR